MIIAHLFHFFGFGQANNNYIIGGLDRFLYNRSMSKPLHWKDMISYLPAVFLALGLGWLLYRFVIAEPVSLRSAPPPRPTIVSRKEWGARLLDLNASEEFGLFDVESNQEGVLYYPDDLRAILNTIVVHHTAIPDASPAEIQELHIDRRGFADIAYHFLIDAEGIIYEGRKINIRGAHVQGFNTGSVGIVLIGNFNETTPTSSQVESLEELVDYLRYTYELRYLAGHKDYPDQSPDGTECPGENLYPLLPDLAHSLGMKYGIEGYVKPDWIE
jgi:hypothetical protein